MKANLLTNSIDKVKSGFSGLLLDYYLCYRLRLKFWFQKLVNFEL